ncbi:MAG: pyridoxamine 5'-phosphate oxidase family protein [Pseudomonadota bacterium]
MPDPWQDLSALRTHLWDRLVRGAAQADDPFRIVAFATAGPDGPEARMVGLRAADREAGTVEIHSDRRTAKIRAVAEDPRAALLLWDPSTQEQLRLTLDITVIPADPARWAVIPSPSRLNYGTDPAPGTPVTAPEGVARRAIMDRHVALSGRVRSLDAVSLAHDPHRRARFYAEADGGRWVAP